MLLTYLFILSVLIFISITVYYGILNKVFIKEGIKGDFILVYKVHTGDYKKIKNEINEVYEELKRFNIISKKGFALYLDNPLYVEKSYLKSLGGCILENNDPGLLPFLKQKGFLTLYQKKEKAYYTEFIHKGEFSIFLSLFKVYPKLMKTMARESGFETVLEVYDILGKKIKYYSFISLTKEKVIDILRKNEKS